MAAAQVYQPVQCKENWFLYPAEAPYVTVFLGEEIQWIQEAKDLGQVQYGSHRQIVKT